MKIHLMRSEDYSHCGVVAPCWLEYPDGSTQRITAADFPNKTDDPWKVTCLSCIRFAGLPDILRQLQVGRCKNGHAITFRSVYVRPNGKKECRKCITARHRKHRPPKYLTPPAPVQGLTADIAKTLEELEPVNSRTVAKQGV